MTISTTCILAMVICTTGACVGGFWGNGTRILCLYIYILIYIYTLEAAPAVVEDEFLFFHVFPLANPPYARWGVEQCRTCLFVASFINPRSSTSSIVSDCKWYSTHLGIEFAMIQMPQVHIVCHPRYNT